ncbi:MAG: hypothetical protein AAFX02_04985 [Pseudomonadota bacterium]
MARAIGWIVTSLVLSVLSACGSTDSEAALEARYKALRKAGILKTGEVPDLSYFSSRTGVGKHGSVLVGQTLVSWWPDDDGDTVILPQYIGEICVFTLGAPPIEALTYQHTSYILKHARDLENHRIVLRDRDLESSTFIKDVKAKNDALMHPEVRRACDADQEPLWQIVADSNGAQLGLREGYDIPSDIYSFMQDTGILLPKERVRLFYSGAQYEPTERGFFVSDKRVAGWWTHRGQVESWSADLGKFCFFTETYTNMDYGNGSNGFAWRIGDARVGRFVLPHDPLTVGLLVAEIERLNEPKQSEDDRLTCSIKRQRASTGDLEPQ